MYLILFKGIQGFIKDQSGSERHEFEHVRWSDHSLTGAQRCRENDHDVHFDW